MTIPHRSITARRDLYAEVTDSIVASLEKGVLPWVKTWDDKAEEGGGEELSPREALALWEAMQEPTPECPVSGTDDPAAYLAACAPALRLALADLTEWATRQGGYEAREWDVARALLDHLRDKGA